ncbi:MAG: M3 family metallopeptidase, partial [Candidatus Woesearchaeota archaeon]|nr:M3 family metallopeptidase [Candidatus Woesearchaeota archaeon]
IINLKEVNGSNALQTVYDILATGFTFPWDGSQVTQNELLAKVRDSSSTVRKKAYDTLFEVFKEQESVFGEIYRALVADWHSECIDLRKYKTPISVRNIGNDLSDAAVQVLLRVAQKNQTVFQEYFSLKAKLLGTKKFSRYDLYAPIVSSASSEESGSKTKETIPYQEACEIVLETFKDFSPVFNSLAQSMFDEGHIHSVVSRGKNQGAFCSSSVPSVKPFVLLNYVGDERSVSTLAHELGHAIHFMLAAKEHSVFHAHSCLPLAETASIFSELLLVDKLKKLKPKLARSLIFQELDNAYASIGRQIEFVAFEQEAHELIKNHGSTNDLRELYLKRLRAHFGSECDVPKCFESEWSYISHIFHTPFYCYAYGFGNLLACSVFAQYKKQGDRVADKFIALLSAGGSSSPSEIVKLMGFDIASESFWQQGFGVLKELLEEAKKN